MVRQVWNTKVGRCNDDTFSAWRRPALPQAQLRQAIDEGSSIAGCSGSTSASTTRPRRSPTTQNGVSFSGGVLDINWRPFTNPGDLDDRTKALTDLMEKNL